MMRVAIVAIVVGFSGAAEALVHPPLLEAEEGCERWVGGASGNDRSVRLNLVICNKDGTASGYAQWSSLVSGWNVRAIAGTVIGPTVTLRDTQIVEERPEPGWRFCVIDEWKLAVTANGKRMEGTYDSSACDDHATVWLDKIDDPPKPDPGSGSGSATPKPPTTNEPPKGPEPPKKRGDVSCRCASGRSPGAGDLIVLLAIALIVSRGRAT